MPSPIEFITILMLIVALALAINRVMESDMPNDSE